MDLIIAPRNFFRITRSPSNCVWNTVQSRPRTDRLLHLSRSPFLKSCEFIRIWNLMPVSCLGVNVLSASLTKILRSPMASKTMTRFYDDIDHFFCCYCTFNQSFRGNKSVTFEQMYKDGWNIISYSISNWTPVDV